MKAAVHNLTFLTLAVVAFNQAVAQKSSYTTNSGMAIGFGFGASYQQSDITNSRGAGFDFTLGHHIYKKENAFFSVDWKLRFLAGENKAYDHRINPDTTYNNIRSDIVNLDLEFGLTLNRLRERTRIVITGFAGAGMTYGRTFTDLYDSNGLVYDYSVINPNQERGKIHADLVKLSDGNFETPLVNRAAILPTLGIFIGYQFSPSFMLGIEHKTNFSLTEQNSWNGINIDNNIMPGSKMDRIHYTTLSLRWNLRGRSSGSGGNYTYSGLNDATPANKAIETTEPITTPPPVRAFYPPVVDITVPAGSDYSTTVERIEISAWVQNVSSKQDIHVVLNGNNIGFEFNPGTGIIKSSLILTDGQNNLVITGANQAGSARDNASIILNKPVRSALPVVRFINPPGPVTVENNLFGISVQTVNVRAWQDVTVTINGTKTNNFSLSAEGVVTTNVGLKEGANKIEVSGKNESGITTEMATITYIKPVKIKPPTITILIPGTDPYNTFQSSQEIRAIVTDIKGKENISVYFNGKNSSDFTYDNNSLELNANITLNEGRNEINITARNEAGQDVKSQVVIKETRPVTEARPVTETRPVTEAKPCPPPVLRRIAPPQNDLTTDNPSYTFRTEVKNIAGSDQLLLTFNSRSITSFTFDGNEIIYKASLKAGSNSLVLVAKNSCGTVSVTSSIIYRPAEPITVEKKPCPGPGLNFSINTINQIDATHELKGSVSNVKNRSDIKITVNNNPYEGFQFVPNTGVLGARFKFNPGTSIIKVSVSNECGQASGSDTVIIKQPKPCPQPVLNMIAPVQNDLITDRPSYTYRTEVKNISGRDQLLLTVNSKSITSFNFDGKELIYAASLNAGSNSFILTAKNTCGTITVTSSIIYRPSEPIKEESTCGPRINPGNSSWQFCLVTPSDTFNRENLMNSNFSYSGRASSLFIMPVAGGGDAVVNGNPYNLKPGQFYLFKGNLKVTVSTKNPGSMGHWSVCINSDKEPVYGIGSNRPKSPCEELEDESTRNKPVPSKEDKKDSVKTGGKK